jgi:hypothetical protein
MDSFYPFKIRRTFAPSNNDNAIFDMLEQPKFQKAGIEKQNTETQRYREEKLCDSVSLC